VVMCRCKYPKIISKKNINLVEDELGDRCYKTSFTLGNNGKNVLIISRAPKGIESNSCNSEYRRIIKYLNDKSLELKGIKKITIVNLFVLYEVNKEDLFREYLLEGKEYVEGNDNKVTNDSIIREEIKEADYIFCAWGEPAEGMYDLYSNRVETILKILREEIMSSKDKKYALRVGDVSKKGYPKHCLAWSYKDEINNLLE
ncbi:DUF1643 domain-containing protein, partial [Clostridium paraputrificum]